MSQTSELHDPSVRVLGCPACGEPVVARPEGLHFGARCPACGADASRELRELAPAPAFGHGYRTGLPAAEDAKPYAPREAISAVGSRLLTFHGLPRAVAALRAAWAKADPAERARLAPSRFWHDGLLATQHLVRGDLRRGRALLETLLEDCDAPGARELLLGRLARVAAADGDAELAARWLAALPVDSLYRDAAEERWLGQVMLARTAAEPASYVAQAEALRVGAANQDLAVALQIDALERAGRPADAWARWRAAPRARRRTIDFALAVYGLAPLVREEAVARRKATRLAVGLLAVTLLVQGRARGAVALLPPVLLGLVVIGETVRRLRARSG